MAFEFIETTEELSHWEGILHQWIYINKETYKTTNSVHAPYSYRERPNISALASAAVKAGWLALEECWLPKNNSFNEYHGRADLMIWKENKSSIIEAKLTCDTFDKLKSKKIINRRDSSREDAKKCLITKASEHIALTFVIPRFEENQNNYSQNVTELIQFCRDLSPAPGLFATTFPGQVSRKTGDKNDDQMFSSGVILIGEIVYPEQSCRAQ